MNFKIHVTDLGTNLHTRDFISRGDNIWQNNVNLPYVPQHRILGFAFVFQSVGSYIIVKFPS